MSRETVSRVQQQTVTPSPLANNVLQRKCACGQHTIGGGECTACRQKREGTLQRHSVNQTEPTGVPPIVDEVLRSPGQPLDPSTRGFMESRFGYDFSRVRVHTDAKAAESAQGVSALAYTVGRDVVFGARQYAPETSGGKRLLAHELAHTVQQEHRAVLARRPLKVGPPNDVYEHEATWVADRITAEDARLACDFTPARPSVQRVCGSAAIGKPSGCIGLGGVSVFDISSSSDELYLFDKDCDDFESGEEARLMTLPSKIGPSAVIDIHGFASEEGRAESAEFNEHLSCARALKAKSVLTGAGVLPASIGTVYKHGATPGPRDEHRSVVIPLPPPPSLTRHHFRAAAVSFFSCAQCNPFTDDGTLGITPPGTEPPVASSFRQRQHIEAELGTFDGLTIAPGTARLVSSGHNVGTSGFCGISTRAHVVRFTGPTSPAFMSPGAHGQGIEFESTLVSRVGAVVPPTLPGSPCGFLGTNTLIPVISNTFKMRLFADGTKESEFVAASLYPSHFMYEDGALKRFGGAPVRPRQDFFAWASSIVPLAAGITGFKALRFACCHPTQPLSTRACATICAGGFSVPIPLLFDSLLCAAHATFLLVSACPTPCAPAGASCTPLVRPSNP